MFVLEDIININKVLYDYFKEDIINYVIGPIPENEREMLLQGVEKAAKATMEILKNGVDKAMNQFNVK